QGPPHGGLPVARLVSLDHQRQILIPDHASIWKSNDLELRRWPLREGAVQHLRQALDVELEAAGVQLKGLPTHQPSQPRWQLVGSGKSRPLNQDWDDTDVTLQGCLDLQPHEVFGVVEASPPLVVGGREPPVSDERQENSTGPDRSIDHLDKVVSEPD